MRTLTAVHRSRPLHCPFACARTHVCARCDNARGCRRNRQQIADAINKRTWTG
jgi:hypothetical protein